jgi:hypothetical protein
MPVEINWNLFKTSGKWAYGGKVTISGSNSIWQPDQLLAEIDGLQEEVIKGTITRRSYLLVISETDTQGADPKYTGQFFTCAYMAKGS